MIDAGRAHETGPGPHGDGRVALAFLAILGVIFAVPIGYIAYALSAAPPADGGPFPPVERPVVTFAAPTLTSEGVRTSIASVSRAVVPENYRINLAVNGTAGNPVVLGTSMTLTVAGDAYAATWVDIGGEGTVNGGDAIFVVRPGGLPTSSTFTLYLLWHDGIQIASVSWTTA